MSDTLREAVVSAAVRNRMLSTYEAFTEGARAAHRDAADDLDTILAAHPAGAETEWGRQYDYAGEMRLTCAEPDTEAAAKELTRLHGGTLVSRQVTPWEVSK